MADLDELYDDARDILKEALGNDKYMTGAREQLAQWTVDRWLRKHEVDQRYELERYQSGIDFADADPVDVSSPEKPTHEHYYQALGTDRLFCQCGDVKYADANAAEQTS